MKLLEEIKKNSYLKPSNLMDLNDIEAALDDLKELEVKCGESKTLNRLFGRIFNRKLKLGFKLTDH